MTYSIKLHYYTDLDYRGIVHISEIYNECLELLGKEKEVFYELGNKEDTEEIIIYGEAYNETEKLKEIFEIEGIRDLGTSYYVILKINFVDIQESEIDEFQENFFSFLKDKVQFIYKFEDSRFLEVRKKFFEDIYNIEINLREVISFIFFTTYYDFGDFLKDLKINDITSKLKLTQEDLKENFENEFFYISFKDYKNLLELRDLKENEKTELMRDSASFEDWKKRIFERGIKDEPYIDFINSIKQDLEVLENFRNAIMHSHSFTDKLRQNYEKSKDEMLKKIGDFRNTHINIFGNELGLIVGKEYTMLQNLPDFIEGKKYQLKEIAGVSDGVFLGEDGESHVFFDKEFDEFWSE